ncbi:MAG: phosphoribosyltransferase family protein [Patescibacteria group bacterium]
MDYKKYIREMKTKNRCDLTLLLANFKVLDNLIKDMARPFLHSKIDKVVALEAMGFIFGTGVARELKAGLCLIRKPNKIAWSTESIDFTDYTKQRKCFEIAKSAILPNEKVLIVDDWSETASQLKAAIFLVEQAKGIIVGISCVNIDDQAKNDKIISKYKLNSVINY